METLNVTLASLPTQTPVLYDLLIASRKNGYGTTSHADAPILWWKVAGCEKEKPARPVTLIHPMIQKRLAAYELADTEVQVNQVIRKYRRIGPAPVRAESKPKADKTRCDNYTRNPNSDSIALERCRKVARYRLTIQSGGEPHEVERCQGCRDELHAKIESGATFEILSEETLD